MGFGEVVRRLRLQAGLTQEQVADRSGLSVATIARLEAGRVGTPRPTSLVMLADALELKDAERSTLFAAARGEAADRDPAPRYLPHDVPDFAGRDAEIRRLTAAVDVGSLVIFAVDGMAGIGKTALAVRLGHALAERYPDGQLFVDLYGFTPGREPLDPAAALETLLRALGVASAKIPHQLEQRAGLWRAEVAARKVLVVLDNAAAIEQVRPLLPGASGSLVLVTSRRRLTGLETTVSLSLDVLSAQEATALFTSIVGTERAAAESDAVAEVLRLCGYLPLATRIAAARLRDRPSWTSSHLAERLRDEQERLAELAVDGRDVAIALAVSCRDLPPAQRRLFRLLSLHLGDSIDAHAAAALLDLRARHSEDLLERLVDQHLLQQPAPGRYVLHDLLRLHGRAMAMAEDDEEARTAAVDRLAGHYLSAASSAMDALYPQHRDRRPKIPATVTLDLSDPHLARAWLDRERVNLLAVAVGRPAYAVLMSTMIWQYLQTSGDNTGALHLHHTALEQAIARGDGAGEVAVLINLANMYWRLEDHAQARHYYEQALSRCRDLDDRPGQARALANLSLVHLRVGEMRRSADLQEQAIALFGDLGDLAGQATALANLAIAYHGLGESERAVDVLQRAVAICRDLGDMHGLAYGLSNLGDFYLESGRYDLALDCTQKAKDLFERIGERAGTAYAMGTIGQLHRRLGHHDQAATHLARAAAALAELGDIHTRLTALNELAGVMNDTGDFVEALRLYEEVGELADQAGQHQAAAFVGAGHAHRGLGRPQEARTSWKQALRLYEELDLPEAAEVRALLAT